MGLVDGAPEFYMASYQCGGKIGFELASWRSYPESRWSVNRRRKALPEACCYGNRQVLGVVYLSSLFSWLGICDDY